MENENYHDDHFHFHHTQAPQDQVCFRILRANVQYQILVFFWGGGGGGGGGGGSMQTNP